MTHLLPGLKKYSDTIYPEQKNLFSKLAHGQSPHTMLVTCSDSRIDPNLLTQTEPGELFVLRNAGNIVPAFGASTGGEEAAIEFAIKGLGVKNIVVCGHSKCGAMAALSSGADMSELPSTGKWLEHASATKQRIAKLKTTDLNKCIEENTLVQIQNLKTHPSVSAALMAGELRLFAWVYHFDQGYVSLFNHHEKKFISSQLLEDKKIENFEL